MIFIIAEDTDKEGTGLLTVMDEELGKSYCYSEKGPGVFRQLVLAFAHFSVFR